MSERGISILVENVLCIWTLPLPISIGWLKFSVSAKKQGFSLTFSYLYFAEILHFVHGFFFIWKTDFPSFFGKIFNGFDGFHGFFLMQKTDFASLLNQIFYHFHGVFFSKTDFHWFWGKFLNCLNGQFLCNGTDYLFSEDILFWAWQYNSFFL